MIDKAHVLMMARYNAWQNQQIMDIVKTADTALLYKDLGAFFGSIMGTLNHLLWADTLWMSRFCDDVKAPTQLPEKWEEYTETVGVWQAERFRLDGRIRIWAATLSNLDLAGVITWHSQIMGRTLETPRSDAITHLFNHQTHHRGQVHAMLTASGLTAPVTDLLFMPKDA